MTACTRGAGASFHELPTGELAISVPIYRPHTLVHVHGVVTIVGYEDVQVAVTINIYNLDDVTISSV
jgi:hypothetical protein